MEVFEKINYLIKERQMSRSEFIKKLLALQPRLKRTGEVPSVHTIQGYLSGTRELRIELIPYIAEVLGVPEQDLFSNDMEYSYSYNLRYTREARDILNLLQYAPRNIVSHIRSVLEKYKRLYDENKEIIK